MAYPPISALPSPPSRQDPTNFANEADAFLGAIPTFGAETNTAGVYFDSQNAIATTQAGIATTQATAAVASAATASAAASAAESSSNSSLWVSGTTYAQGDNVYSPVTFFTYRAKLAFVSTTDPSADSASWALIGVGGTALLTTTNVVATAGQTAFSGTYAAGAVVVTLNGVVLTETLDYTATDGAIVNLVTGASAGDNLTIIGFPAFAIANTLALTGGQLTGSLGGTTAAFTGDVSGDTLTAAGAVSGGSVSATNGVSGATVSSTGAVTGDSVSATLGVSGATVAATGAVTAGSGTISGEFIANSYNEKFVSLTAAATVDINCETGNVFALTTDQDTTFTFSNPPAAGTAFGFMLRITSGVAQTITYPTTVIFTKGIAPDAPDVGETDVLVFTSTDAGATWYGALAIDAAA